MVTERASPALTKGAYEFEPRRLEPAPELSPNRLVFNVAVLTRGLPHWGEDRMLNAENDREIGQCDPNATSMRHQSHPKAC